MKLGWIPFGSRTAEQNASHISAVANMRPFGIIGSVGAPPAKVILADAWKHPTITAALGQPFTGFHQLTGSCVGAGGGNAFQTLACIEAIAGRINPCLIWWPLTYGRGRLDAGMRGQGEGSLGAAEAQAAKEDGLLTADYTGLPKFSINDGQFTLTEQIEMQWSDGAQISSAALAESRQHLVKTVSQLDNPAQVASAIQNGYPVTIACGMFVNPNTPTIQGSGDDAVLIGQLNGQGGHQQSIQAFWAHPTLGNLYFLMNQWGQSVYDRDPAGGPLGGSWIKEVAMKYICDNGEVYAFSQWDGYPAQQLNYLLG